MGIWMTGCPGWFAFTFSTEMSECCLEIWCYALFEEWLCMMTRQLEVHGEQIWCATALYILCLRKIGHGEVRYCIVRGRKITSCRKDSEPMRSKGGTISSAVQCGRLTWESCSRCFWKWVFRYLTLNSIMTISRLWTSTTYLRVISSNINPVNPSWP